MNNPQPFDINRAPPRPPSGYPHVPGTPGRRSRRDQPLPGSEPVLNDGDDDDGDDLPDADDDVAGRRPTRQH